MLASVCPSIMILYSVDMTVFCTVLRQILTRRELKYIQKTGRVLIVECVGHPLLLGVNEHFRGLLDILMSFMNVKAYLS